MSKPKWVIMVYIAANDTLANFAIESLKQLQETATNEVVVVAQFDPDGLSSEHQVRRYVFNLETRDKPLLDDNKFWGNADHRFLSMSEPGTLTEFMEWVYRDYPAEHYCLTLWAEGPLLLFQLPAKSDREILPLGAGAYLTPAQLKQALHNARGVRKEVADAQGEGKKLEIIAMDACSMSMCEIAYELKDEAEFLVASQEEVPDPSFRYDMLVKLFSEGLGSKELCQAGVVGYVTAYQQYFYSQSTGTYPVTLAAIELKQMQNLKGPLKELANALTSATKDTLTADLIYSARAQSQSYVGGLYVDLHDFCNKLGGATQFAKVCGNVSKAIDNAVAARAGVVNGCVVEVVNHAAASTGTVYGPVMRVNGEAVKSGKPELLSYGLSIYFPYLKDAKENDHIQDVVKGIPRMIDKDSEMLAGYRVLIKDIEDDYQDSQFDFARDTNWYQFIQQGWSLILASQDPDDLDTLYLARQCVKNLLTIIQSSGVSGAAAA